jgi:uncharacterized protein YraI
MSVRSLAFRTLFIGLASALFGAHSPSIVRAEDTLPQVDNSKVSVVGIVNTNDVYVRSGPGENYYATVKLEKGAQVTVVGLKYDWLKIVPPEGSFSYVAKAYVEKRGDGTVGRVTKPDLNVRAGSDLVVIKDVVQTKLEENQDVTILGEQDEYFKIKSPPGAYLYINKQFVDQAKDVPVVATATGAEPVASSPIQPIVSKTPDAGAATTQPTLAAAPTTQSTDSEAAAAPATQPAVPLAQTQFDALETAFLDATNLPLEKQPIDTLMTGYQTLTKAGELPVSMQRIAEMRLVTLKLRADARDQYADAQKMQEEARARQTALKAEQDELIQRVKDNSVTMYTALGTLRTSSLQQTGGTLYRLTDPSTGHTLLYVRSSDPQFGSLMNQFIGVRGDITEDAMMSIKVISPTAAEVVDQSKVNGTISAQIIPPSLLPKVPTASISGN